MPIEQAGVDVTVKAFFVESKVGKTGLTVTVDVYNPAGSKVVSDASATEVGGGLYTYTILGSSIPSTAGEWVAVFKTATTSVDVQHIPTIWVIGRVAEDVADVETKVDTAQADLDTITGSDGVTLATTQGNYAPAKAGDNMGTVSAVTGGINTGAGTITTLDALDTAQDTQHSTTQAATTSILAKLLAYFRLLLRSDAGPTTDDATELTAINADGGSGAGNYDPTTDSAEAIADGGGGGLDAAGVRAAVGLASANLDTQLAALPTAEENALQVWEEDSGDHNTSGTMGARLNAAGAAADPLENPVPGSYVDGTAGYYLGLLATIHAHSILITSGRVIAIVAPTVGAGGYLTIYRGADYVTGDLDLDVPGTHDLTGATSVTITCAAFTKTMTIVSSGGDVQTVRFTLTAAETAVMRLGKHPWLITAVLASGSTKPIAEGTVEVKGTP